MSLSVSPSLSTYACFSIALNESMYCQQEGQTFPEMALTTIRSHDTLNDASSDGDLFMKSSLHGEAPLCNSVFACKAYLTYI